MGESINTEGWGLIAGNGDFPLLVRWYREGKLPLDKLVTKRYKLEQINEACDALAKGQISGRAIVEF